MSDEVSSKSTLALTVQDILKQLGYGRKFRRGDDFQKFVGLLKIAFLYAGLSDADVRSAPYHLLDAPLFQDFANSKDGVLAKPDKKALDRELFLDSISKFLNSTVTLPTALALSRPDSFNFDLNDFSVDSALEWSEKTVKMLQTASARPTASLEILSLILPEHLRSPLGSYLASHADPDVATARSMLISLHAQSRVSVPTSIPSNSQRSKPAAKAVGSSSTKSAVPQPGDADYAADQFCKYCNVAGHNIDDCRTKYKLASKNSSNSSSVNAKSYFVPSSGTISPSPHSSDSTPKFVGHSVFDATVSVPSGLSFATHVLADSGSTRYSLIQEGLHLKLFPKSVLPSSSKVSPNPPLYHLGDARVSLNISGRILPVELLIVEDALLQVPILLCVDDMRRFGISLDFPRSFAHFAPLPPKWRREFNLPLRDYSIVNPRAYVGVRTKNYSISSRVPHVYELDDLLDSDSD